VKSRLERENGCLEHSDTLSPILCGSLRRIFFVSFPIAAASGNKIQLISLDPTE
jgi:hypothetical protein